MAEPYDFLLSKYIELGKQNQKYANQSANVVMLIQARELTEQQFDNTYTNEEYDAATFAAEDYIKLTYKNIFTRIPD